LSAAILEHGFATAEGTRKEILIDAAQWREGFRVGNWRAARVLTAGPLLLLRAAQPVDAATDLPDELRQWAAARLPAYMVLDRVGVLPRVRLNGNGKDDRNSVKRLFAQIGELPGKEVEAPQGELEAQVAGIWTELLGIERVGRRQTFLSLGGDSLLATRLVELIRQRLTANVSLRQLFLAPTVAELTSLIAEQRRAISAGGIEDGVI
jgi:acyl carrier protein